MIDLREMPRGRCSVCKVMSKRKASTARPAGGAFGLRYQSRHEMIMKTNTICFLSGVVVICTTAQAQQKEISQGRVSTGWVLEVSKDSGDVTLRSQQSARALVFRGLQTTPVYFSSGRRATFGDIEPGKPATIYYAPAGERWLISRIVIPDSAHSLPASQALTPAQSSMPYTRRGSFHIPRVPNTMR
jgi:hypothetical protein